MSELVYKAAINVDTYDGEKSVKGLKDEIKKLQDHILNLTKGTDEYAFAVKKLQDDQRELDNIMSLTKKTAFALEGSYDALVHQMGLLKKEWRATNDEARRNELSEQIASINTQLKEMDAELGNFQRNVGNYTSALDGLDDKTVSFKESMGQMNDTIEPTKAKFEAVQKISSGVASGFAAVQGAAALLGAETEDLEKVFVKVQSAMALAQGVGGLGDLVEGVGKAKVAFEGLGDKIKAVSKVMGKAGWIGVIVAVTAAIAALVVHLKKKNDEIKDGTKALQDYKKAGDEAVGTYVDEITKLRLLEKAATDTTLAERDRNEAAKEVLKIIGDETTSTNLLAVKNGDYADVINTKVIPALVARARAEAAIQLIQEKQKEILEQEIKIKDRESKPNDWDYTRASLLNVMSEGNSFNQGFTPEVYQEEGVENEKKKLAQMKADLQTFTTNLFKDFDWSVIYQGLGGGNNGGGDEEKIPTPEEILAEIIPQLIDSIEIPDIPIEPLDTTVQMQEEGAVYKKVKASMLAIAKTYAGDSVKIEERKLARLKELHQQAVNVGDYESQLLLQQDIADQEVALNQAKNDALVQSDEEAAQKRIDIINKISASMSAAADVTQGILEITQAAYEKDGEISAKEAKKIKGMQIAIATMNMLAGITAALSGAFTLKSGPWDIALAAVQAASIAASGTANIMKIKNTDLTGSVSGGAQAAVTPNSNIYGTDLPMSYVRNVTTASETDMLNQDTRVYILESDIQESNKRVKVRQSESSF